MEKDSLDRRSLLRRAVFIIDPSWTLFLDRDGVLNRRIDGYVQHPEALEIFPYVPQTLAVFTKLFKHIIVVTNQQGIGKGLMSEEDLRRVHAHLQAQVAAAGGRIDAIFHAPDLADRPSVDRKPNVGMGLKAKKAFPDINFKKSIMVGDTFTDILFGKRLGMKTVWIPEGLSASLSIEPDLVLENLAALVDFLQPQTR